MVKTLTRSAARVYGVLTALGDGSPDVLERLIPFFEPILRPKQGERLDLDAFAKEVRDTLRWNFNTDIVEVFIPRLTDAGWLTPDNLAIEQTTYTISLPDQILEPALEASVNAQLRAIAEQFKAFSESLSPLTALPLDVEEFEDILIEWLLYVEAYSEHNIDFKISTNPDSSGTLRQTVEIPHTTSLTNEEEFLCARFVQHAIETDPGISEVLTKIASIGLLTEAVQDFVKPDTPVEETNLVIFLDAPVALELLGVSGAAARENTQPIISELQRIGASIRIFSQSVEELKSNLRGVLQNPRPTGPTAQAMARGDVLKEFVVEVCSNPESFLEDLGVGMTHRPIEQTPSEHSFFTNDNRTEIYSALAFQQNPRARDHDSDITTMVMRQRRGVEDRDLFKSRFLVMTRNGLLAQLVRKKCVQMGLLSSTAMPPIVHRRVIAAIMWLRTGLGSNGLEVPKRLLLANCASVLAIRPGVVEAVRRITDALGDEEKARQLDLLVTQDRSAQMLMDKTLGAPSVVTKANISQLFEEMLHPHLEEERKRGAVLAEEEKKIGRQNLKNANAELQKSKETENSLAEKLGERLKEDREAVEALCGNIESTLATKRKWMRGLGLALAIIFCLPPFLYPSIWQIWLTFPFAILLAYLTITGSKLIGTVTSEKKALSALKATANARRLDAKLSRFNIGWNGEEFSLVEPEIMPANDLFEASSTELQ